MRATLNSSIKDAISAAIAEKVLPSIQSTLETQVYYYTVMDRIPVGYKGAPEPYIPGKHGKFTSNRAFHVKTRDKRLGRVP